MRRRARQDRTDTTKPQKIAAPRDLSGLFALTGGWLLWMAFPPVGWSILAWIAPFPWLMICRSPNPITRRGYWSIWIAGVLFWLVLLQGIRKAHPANNLGLCALSLYLATYLPLFIAIVRGAMHHSRVPSWFAAPIVWSGLELLRGGLFTGFSAALLGHTQVGSIWLIQIADVTGAYGVSFLLMLFAAALHELIVSGWALAPGSTTQTAVLPVASAIPLNLSPSLKKKRAWMPIIAAMIAIAGTCGYGWWRVQQPPQTSPPPLHVALLQGTRDKVFEDNPELERRSFEQYFDLMKRARDAKYNLDVIVWPEGSFTELLHELIVDGPLEVPADAHISPEEVQKNVEERQRAFAAKLRAVVVEANRDTTIYKRGFRSVDLILGVGTFELNGAKTRSRNTALWVRAPGEIAGRYYKMHLVMFGEYVPFSRLIPWLNRTPIGPGVTPGEKPAAFDIAGYRLSPNICFESTVPHVIRGHVRNIAKEMGRAPDILINITDDGWFWGSSILDLHLACSIFRAVEMRRPFLIAANTGISANVDGNGRVLERLPHRQAGFILADVSRDGRYSFYEHWGDVFAGMCLVITAFWAIRGAIRARRPAFTDSGEPAGVSPRT